MFHRSPARRVTTAVTALIAAAALAVTGCSGSSEAKGSGKWSSDTLTLDFATYSPLSLVIKDQGWLEKTLGDDVEVTWVQSAGSNKANENLRANAIDIGSTAGSAALLSRSNDAPIQTIALYDQPEWAALVVAKDSDITSVADLKGRSVAATKGTDPYFFLVQALAEHGVELDDVDVQQLQHSEGRVALENGTVDAWAGLDPMMADSELSAGSKLLYRNVDYNTYGFLNAREQFIKDSPDLAQVVVDAYEKARAWAKDNPEETAQILADVAGIDLAVAKKVITERTNLGISPVPGDQQRAVLEVVGPIFVEAGDVTSQDKIDKALSSLFNDTFALKADPSTISD